MPDPAFWNHLTSAIGPRNTRRLDYIGLDAFPDVFQPVPHEKLPAAVTFLLRRLRAVTTEAGVPQATPIHVTETGWPTERDQRSPGHKGLGAAPPPGLCHARSPRAAVTAARQRYIVSG